MAVTNYLWDVNSYLEEYDEVGITTSAYTNEPTQFGSLVSQRRITTTNFYHYDVLGSTHQLTDQSENVTDTFLYDAWGNQVDRTGTATTIFRYVGEYGYYYDEETESYYVRARIYQPLIGRWWSVDPIGFIDGANLYLAYFIPNAVDPMGTLVVQTILPQELRCGGFDVKFKFRLSNVAPCDGYIVQKIIIYDEEVDCDSGKPCPTGYRPTSIFWEAWYVKKGRTMSSDTAKDGYSDVVTNVENYYTCGHTAHRGSIKFFCKTPLKDGDPGTGDLGDFRKDPESNSGGWKTSNPHTIAGELPSTTIKPDWWDKTPVEGPASRFVTSDWNCCNCEEKRHNDFIYSP